MTANANFTIEQLDAYAKTLSHAQAGRLYECKIGNKFKKQLVEAKDIYQTHRHVLYLDNSVLESMGISKTTFVSEYLLSLNANRKVTGSGIYVYSNDINEMESLVDALKDDGYEEQIKNSLTEDFA